MTTTPPPLEDDLLEMPMPELEDLDNLLDDDSVNLDGEVSAVFTARPPKKSITTPELFVTPDLRATSTFSSARGRGGRRLTHQRSQSDPEPPQTTQSQPNLLTTSTSSSTHQTLQHSASSLAPSSLSSLPGRSASPGSRLFKRLSSLSPSTRRKAAAPGTPAALVENMRSAQAREEVEQVCGSLRVLARNEISRKQIVSAGGIRELKRVVLDRTSSAQAREHAVATLANLAYDKSNADAIAPLLVNFVSLLANNSPGNIQAAASVAVGLLSLHKPHLRKEAERLGAVASLVAIVRKPQAEGAERAKAAYALAQMANGSNIMKKSVGDWDGIKALIGLVGDGSTDDEKGAAVGALSVLMHNNSANQSKAVDAGCAPLMALLVIESPSRTLLHAVEIMVNVTAQLDRTNDSSVYWLSQIRDLQGGAALAGLLAEPSLPPNVLDRVVIALTNLAPECPAIVARAIPALDNVLRTASPIARRYAAALLASLACDATYVVDIGEYGLIDPLVALMRGDTSAATDDAREQAVGALWRLSVHPENQAQIASRGALALAIDMLDRKDRPQMQEWAAGLLTSLAENNIDNQVALTLQPGFQDRLNTLLSSHGKSTAALRRHVTRLLLTMSREADEGDRHVDDDD